ncbi:MAG: GNAT family N-acetyltransferase [Planctomycetota bacterium]
MKYSLRQVQEPHPCGYLPDRLQSLEVILATSVSAAEYQSLMERGWRHFGHVLFQPACQGCVRCRTVRVDAARFAPNRSQRRVAWLNAGAMEPEFNDPHCRPEVLDLYDSWHAAQSDRKGWPLHEPGAEDDFTRSFIRQPFRVEQWEYRLNGALAAVGYVDVLPEALSAVYFFYDSSLLGRSPGIWNILRMIDEANRRGLPHVYLGYLVEGCPGMAYKGNFHPAEYRERGKDWMPLPADGGAREW